MLNFLLLIGVGGAPLTAELVASLGRRPTPALRQGATDTRVWLSGDRRVGFVGWQAAAERRGGSHWHVGDHGVTAFAGSPRRSGGWRGHRSWAAQLTDLVDPAVPDGLADLRGTWTVLRLGPDGAGWIAADAAGAGSVHVARSQEVVALSDRAGVAAAALGTGRRACEIRSLAAAGAQDAGAAWRGTRTVPTGRWLRITAQGQVELRAPAAAAEAPSPGELRDGIVATLEQAAAWTGPRLVDLDGSTGSTLVGAAIHSAGLVERFRFRAVGTPDDRQRARAVAARLGVTLEETAPVAQGSASAVDARVRTVVAASEGSLTPPHAVTALPLEAALVVRALPSGLGGTVAARRAWTEELLLGGPLRIDPLEAARTPAEGPIDIPRLLAAVDPGWDLPPPPEDVGPAPGTEHLGPLLLARREAATAALADADLDLPTLLDRLRDTDGRDAEAERWAWAVLTAATWLAHQEERTAARGRPTRPAARPDPSTEQLTLVTGVTSRSLPGLVDLRVPVEERRSDALLGTAVDGPVADLCDRLLLAADATTLDRPVALAGRLASSATAPYADVARALAARRGGVLADARLGLLLPFWTTHVDPSPRLVLVQERPAELLATSTSPLAGQELLWLWIDVVASTLLASPTARVVDPRDLADLDVPEGVGPDHAAPTDTLRVASVLDGLVRELDASEIAPLLAAVIRRDGDREPSPAAAGRVADDVLDSLAMLWSDAAAGRGDAREAARETRALATRLAALEEELAALRNHPGVRLALRLPGGPRSDR